MPKATNAAIPVLIEHPSFLSWVKENNPPTHLSSSWTRKALDDLGIEWNGGVFRNVTDPKDVNTSWRMALKKTKPEALAELPLTNKPKNKYPPESDKRVVRVLVDTNPKKGKSRERFDRYRDGITVEELRTYYTEDTMHQLMADLRWDVDRGFIKLEDPVPEQNGVPFTVEDYLHGFSEEDAPPALPVALTLKVYEELRMCIIELGNGWVVYREGWSDQAVANECKALPEQVRAVREEGFGVLSQATDAHSHFMMRKLEDYERRLQELEAKLK